MTTRKWLEKIKDNLPDIMMAIEEVESGNISLHINKRGITVEGLILRDNGWINTTLYPTEENKK